MHFCPNKQDVDDKIIDQSLKKSPLDIPQGIIYFLVLVATQCHDSLASFRPAAYPGTMNKRP